MYKCTLNILHYIQVYNMLFTSAPGHLYRSESRLSASPPHNSNVMSAELINQLNMKITMKGNA